MSRCKIRVPGRVNLIGEHIDYHNLPVLPMAIPRYITLEWAPSKGNLVQVESAGYGVRQLPLGGFIEPSAPGDWENYLKAAVKAVQTRWSVSMGFQGSITSDLPSAAGLSSSSALITALTLALLYANDIQPTLEDLMSILPEGEQFVGTRGGGMDHAAVLASREGFASLLHFNPFAVEHVRVPDDWRFLVAHSLVRAEKSGAAKARYNACRTAGLSALAKLGLSSFKEASWKMLPALAETSATHFNMSSANLIASRKLSTPCAAVDVPSSEPFSPLPTAACAASYRSAVRRWTELLTLPTPQEPTVPD